MSDKVALLSRIVGDDPEARNRLARAGIEIVIDLAGYDGLMAEAGRPAWLATLESVTGLVVGLQAVDRELFDAAPNLRYVLRVGTGLDNVDLGAAEERGIVVSNLPGLNAAAVSEYAFTLLLAAARRIPEVHGSMKAGEWKRFKGRQLGGRTLGLIGYGAVARGMVPKAVGFGMDVVVFRRRTEAVEQDGVRMVSLDELIDLAPFVSVHVPLTRETHHLIGAAEIARMDGTVLVNTARGGVVDEQALYHGLVSGRLAAAALDVYAEEPPPDSPLLRLPNVVLSPHNGGYSDVATARTAAAGVDFMIEHCRAAAQAR